VASLFQRASGSLAVKILPAAYGVGLILLVVRAIPLGDFGRYGMAIAYVNIVAAVSRGLWMIPLIIRAARGERSRSVAPAFWLSIGTSLVTAGLALVVLPLVGAGFSLAVWAGLMLIVLIPRDMAIALSQADGRVWVAFLIEAGYFVGSLSGFIALSAIGALTTAESVMLVNLAGSIISAVIGVAFEPCLLRPGRHGDWKAAFGLGKWLGLLALGELFLQQGDTLIVGAFFVPAVIAPYVAARTLLRMYTLLSQAVNFLVLPSASRHEAGGQVLRLRRRLKSVLRYMIGFLAGANVIVFFVCPSVFPAVLGAKYAPAIPFFRVMIIATLFEPVYSVLTNALTGVGKPNRTVPVLGTALVFNVALDVILLPIVGLWAAPVVLVLTYGVLALGSVRLARRHLVESEAPTMNSRP
jgi:O-antigen/teichoic acid export membrane protein